MKTTGGVILAAGGSVRLGQPKQFLMHRGKSLIQNAADAAMECSPVVVVTGRDHQHVEEELWSRKAVVVQNKEWEQGMGGSIRLGIRQALKLTPWLDALVILVCDQPFVTQATVAALRQMIEQGRTPAAACRYGGDIGVPAIFHRSLFPQLLSLPDDCGAKRILKSVASLGELEFPEGSIDVDTADDFLHLDRGAIHEALKT